MNKLQNRRKNLIMDYIFIIGLLSKICTHVCLGSTQTARVTLYTTPITWNEAQRFCRAINQTLLTITSQKRLDALKYFLTKEPWNSIREPQFWIGLHAPFKKTRSRFEWEGSCKEPSFAFWGKTPPATTDYRYCTYGSVKKLRVKFETADCFQSEKMFMCEESHGTCLFDVKRNAFGNIMASLHIENASVSICKIACNNFVSETGHRCSGFNYNDVINSCGLMTSDNLYRLDKYHRPSDSNHKMFIKRCDIQAKLETTNTYFRRLCPLGPVSQCAVSRRFCNDSYDEKLPDFGKCVCKCNKPTTKINLTQIIENIVDTIRIPPKNTSIAIRQKISVDDTRMSSRGIGYVAIAIMSTIFGGIILMDLNTLRMHFA